MHEVETACGLDDIAQCSMSLLEGVTREGRHFCVVVVVGTEDDVATVAAAFCNDDDDNPAQGVE